MSLGQNVIFAICIRTTISIKGLLQHILAERRGRALLGQIPSWKGRFETTRRNRLIIASLIVTVIALGSAFVFIQSKGAQAGDPKSFVIDICGPSPLPGGTTSGLLACPTLSGAVAWGVDCVPGTCQFGYGTSTPASAIAITFTWQNCCGSSTTLVPILNTIPLPSVLQQGSTTQGGTYSFTIRIVDACSGCNSLASTYDGSTSTSATVLSANLLSTTCQCAISSGSTIFGGNLLQYSNAQGIVGIRALIAV